MAVLLSTAYFPPIYYFSRIVQGSAITIEKEENFQKQTYRNRCVILGANGPLNLTIPVQHEQPKIKISELSIAYHTNWQIIHFRAVESAYRNSPYFEYYIDDIKGFFKEKHALLFDFNMSILKTCLNLIGCKTSIHCTEQFIKEPVGADDDFRYSITPKKEADKALFPEYHQVFSEKFNFIPNLSILDAIFNIGPETLYYLQGISKKNGQI